MSKQFFDECDKFQSLLEELKKKISEGFSLFGNYDIPVDERPIKAIQEEQRKLEYYISDINEKIAELEENNAQEDLEEIYSAKQDLSNNYKNNEIYLLPESLMFGNNYTSVDDFLNVIKYCNYLSVDETISKFKTYTEVLKDITGSEEKLPEVIELMINDFTNKSEGINLVEEVSKMLETPEQTPKMIVKRP